MSDLDPELPEWLVDALLSDEPPPADVELVKQAFTWRTIDAELMALSYDSVLDEAGVRDAGARRTMEFTLDDLSVVIEIDGRTIRGTVSPTGDGRVELLAGADMVANVDLHDGVFVMEVADAGSYRVILRHPDGVAELPALTLG